MKNYLIAMLVCGLFAGTAATAQSHKPTTKAASVAVRDTTAPPVKPIITFIELGSVNCIPCKAMQPVMKSIEEKYGAQVKIIFYDVWKEDQKAYATQYGVKLIPTQVFLDANGKELMRHQGFFPEKDIELFLQLKGLKSKSGGRG